MTSHQSDMKPQMRRARSVMRLPLPALTSLMNDWDFQVCTAAMNAVAGIGGPEARKLLNQVIATATDEEVRDAAQESYQLIDGESPDTMFRPL